jgi:hypothetical protein
MTALPENARRQLGVYWQGRSNAFATGWNYRLAIEYSSGVGQAAIGAQRIFTGGMAGTTALVEAAGALRVPTVTRVTHRGCYLKLLFTWVYEEKFGN